MTVATYSHFGKASVNGTVMEFQDCSLTKLGTPLVVRDGLRGSLWGEAADVRNGPCYVGGGMTIQPTGTWLKALATLAIPNAANGALTDFSAVVDRSYNVVTYENCKINTFTLRGSQGGILDLSLDLVGKTANTTGTVADVTEGAPCIFSDCTLTIGNTAYEVMEFELVIPNNLRTDRYANNLTLTDIAPAGIVLPTLRTVHAYNANSATLWTSNATAFNTNTLVINDGTTTTTFTFGALQAPREDPPLNSGEVMLTKNWTIRATGNTAAIAVA